MAQEVLTRLEQSVREIPGVLGCVLLATPDGTATEVQAFTRAGEDSSEIEGAIRSRARDLQEVGELGQVFVFELDAESHLGDRDSLLRAAELAEQQARSKGPLSMLQALGTLHSIATSDLGSPEASTARPPLQRVVLSSSPSRSEAQVMLRGGGLEVVGEAEGAKTHHALDVVAEATLRAVAKLVGGRGFRLRDATLLQVFEHEAVLILVDEEELGGLMLGSALVRDAPVSEAAVRATLDAVNRRLMVDVS
jgi:hypothetical protein